MADMHKLIESILSGAKKGAGDTKDKQKADDGVRTKVYRDEPILMTAAQLKNYTPPRYRQMRNLTKGRDVYYDHDARLFYEQAKFMEDYEDEFDYQGEFVRYYPTYQAMNDQELRGYFSWRTKVRRGILEKTSLSFAFVYIYELINQIGVSSPREGFDVLNAFCMAYRELDPRIDRYIRPWLRDYIVYYDLDRSLLEPFVNVDFDNALLTLLHFKDRGPGEILAALKRLSSYNLENSIFYKQYPEDVEQAAAGAFAALSAYYAKNRKYNLCEKFFGKAGGNLHSMFQSAVFFQQGQRHADAVYEINEIYRYRCVRGRWSCERYMQSDGKNRQVGAFLKNIDCRMRLKYGFIPQLKETKCTKIFLETIDKEIDKILEARKKIERRKVEIDVSKLQAIRRTALETQSKLIVEEDVVRPPEPAEELDKAAAKGMVAADRVAGANEADAADGAAWAAGQAEVPLSDGEYELLRRLLYSREYADFVKEQGLMLSVLVDAINEKLFDTFSDTVLLWEGERPELTEDYIDELKGMIEE